MRNGASVARFAVHSGNAFGLARVVVFFIKGCLVFWLHRQFLLCDLRIAVACVDSGPSGGTWLCHHLALAVARKTCPAEVEAGLQLNSLFRLLWSCWEYSCCNIESTTSNIRIWGFSSPDESSKLTYKYVESHWGKSLSNYWHFSNNLMRYLDFSSVLYWGVVRKGSEKGNFWIYFFKPPCNTTWKNQLYWFCCCPAIWSELRSALQKAWALFQLPFLPLKTWLGKDDFHAPLWRTGKYFPGNMYVFLY